MLPEAEGLFMPKQTCVFAARAAGIMPMGFVGTVADFSDLDGFRETVRRSRRLGFVGASVIHPSQIAILNEEFRPGAAEIEHARRVVAAYDKALAEGVGAVTVDGKMIDVPVVERAKLLLRARTRSPRARRGSRRPRLDPRRRTAEHLASRGFRAARRYGGIADNGTLPDTISGSNPCCSKPLIRSRMLGFHSQNARACDGICRRDHRTVVFVYRTCVRRSNSRRFTAFPQPMNRRES